MAAPDPDCPHDTLARVGSTRGVYECDDCSGQLIIPRFRWLGAPATDGTPTAHDPEVREP